ncbi:MAG: acetyl-CoA carboxylase carboxyl transferase subunit alpha [Gammaproteobacteria bacterium]|nr:MAG: acetyl-CoA carboxylase carboxyl transferase subunit alpha [Gammaproteobacteria bacterium]
MNTNFLDFEQPIAELEAKIEELRFLDSDVEIDIQNEIENLEQKSAKRTKSIFANLDAWQISKLSRHPQRPHTKDYIDLIFTDFHQLHGDRNFSDDVAIIGGLAKLDGKPVMVIGHQKGRNTKEKIKNNFAMPRPEGYKKSLRLMELAQKFKLPIFTFIDTPGAYPGIGAEERNQSYAIAYNLYKMSDLATPIICTIIGEGGSGGALAVGVGDEIVMLQYSTYSVISPEGCASILYKNADKASEAAKSMGITADILKEHNLIDTIIEEPLGGAHRDFQKTASSLKNHLNKILSILEAKPIKNLVQNRYDKLMAFGKFDTTTTEN